MLEGLKNTENALQKIAQKIIDDAKMKLDSKGKNVSGTLYNSLQYEMIEENGSLKINFLMADYGPFVDKGVKGKNPSEIKGGRQKAPSSPYQFGTGSGTGSLRTALDKWIVKKGIAPRTELGRFMSRQSMKYAMSKSIYLQGIAPSNFWTEAYESNIGELGSNIDRAFVQDVEDTFLDAFKNIKTKKR
jgi:hypothetical protein